MKIGRRTRSNTKRAHLSQRVIRRQRAAHHAEQNREICWCKENGPWFLQSSCIERCDFFIFFELTLLLRGRLNNSADDSNISRDYLFSIVRHATQPNLGCNCNLFQFEKALWKFWIIAWLQSYLQDSLQALNVTLNLILIHKTFKVLAPTAVKIC